MHTDADAYDCTGSKLQALVYDILLSRRKVPESDTWSVHWKLTLGEKSLAGVTPRTRTRVGIASLFAIGRSTN